MDLIGKLFKKKEVRHVKISGKKFSELKKKRKSIKISAHPNARPREIKKFREEIKKSGTKKIALKSKFDVLPTRVSRFDELITSKGFERGGTVLFSGGAGSGKTTFAAQMLYYGALKGEKGIYLTMEEDPEKMKKHMLDHFGWDFFALEKKGLVKFMKLNPIDVARSVEAQLFKERQKLSIKIDMLKFPFRPDRVIIDSLSALAIAFEESENYRKYLDFLFKKLEELGSVNLAMSETNQNPEVYSRAGIEEFLADGVVVLYNIKVGGTRQQALEILKLRSSQHEKKIVPFTIVPKKGIEVFPEQQLFTGK